MHCGNEQREDWVEVLGMVDVIIPEEEWQKIHDLADRINRCEYEQEKDTRNLNNLLHALHGEGVRASEFSDSGRPEVFQNGKWGTR